MTDRPQVKVVLIGHGHLGKWHAQKCEQIENSILYAIVERKEELRADISKLYPNSKVVSTLEEVIDEIDAALVVTPTSTHFEICKLLIENDKHLFCEKPFTANLEEALLLEKMAKDKSITIQIGHSERFHKVWDKRAQFSPFFEGPAHIKIERCAAFKGRATDVSVVSDLMIHDLDLVDFLFKEKPIELKSQGFKIRTNEYDYVSTTLNYDCGKVVNIINSRNDTEEKRNMIIVNKYGTLFIDLLNNTFSYASGEAELEEDFVVTKPYEKSDHLLIEQDYFYNSILSSSKAIVGIEDGVNAVSMISLVHESLETGRPHTIEQR